MRRVEQLLSLWAVPLVTVLAVLLYLPTVRYGLVDFWDDDINIIQNPYLRPLSLWRLGQIWSHSYAELYVPLLYTAYAFESALSGGSPWIFHLTNALLHALNSALVFGLVGRQTRSLQGALMGALLFAIHPIQTEAVTWVTGQKDTLSALFSFLALWLYLDWRTSGRRLAYAAALAAFMLSLLAKPAAVVLPLLAAGLDLADRHPWRSVARSLAPWLVLSVVWSLATSQAQQTWRPLSLPMRLFVAGDALLFYLRKIVCPHGLAAAYGRSAWELTREPLWWLGLPLSAAAAALIVWKGNRHVRLGSFIFVPVAALLVCICVPLTLRQQTHWKTSQALVERALSVVPPDRVQHDLLSLFHLERRNKKDVITELQSAGRSRPPSQPTRPWSAASRPARGCAWLPWPRRWRCSSCSTLPRVRSAALWSRNDPAPLIASAIPNAATAWHPISPERSCGDASRSPTSSIRSAAATLPAAKSAFPPGHTSWLSSATRSPKAWGCLTQRPLSG